MPPTAVEIIQHPSGLLYKHCHLRYRVGAKREIAPLGREEWLPLISRIGSILALGPYFEHQVARRIDGAASTRISVY